MRLVFVDTALSSAEEGRPNLRRAGRSLEFIRHTVGEAEDLEPIFSVRGLGKKAILAQPRGGEGLLVWGLHESLLRAAADYAERTCRSQRKLLPRFGTVVSSFTSYGLAGPLFWRLLLLPRPRPTLQALTTSLSVRTDAASPPPQDLFRWARILRVPTWDSLLLAGHRESPNF